MWTFAGLMLIALIFGRWRKLGQQGPQVGVAALFAYSSFTQSGASSASYMQLVSIAGLVLLGCTIGVITNLVVVPPMRYRSAEYGISALSRLLCDLLTDLSEGLRDGVPDKDQAEVWQHRADQFPDMVAQARSTVEHAAGNHAIQPAPVSNCAPPPGADLRRQQRPSPAGAARPVPHLLRRGVRRRR